MQAAEIDKSAETVINDNINVGTGYAVLPTAIVLDKTISLKAKVLFAYLLCYKNKDKGYAYPRKNKIQHDLGISIGVLNECLNELVSRGLIKKVQGHKSNGDFGPNRYYIDLDAEKYQQSGFGFIAKEVLTNAEVSIQSKAIYLVIAVYARANYVTILKSIRITSVLGMTRTSMNKRRAELIAHAIISVSERGNSGIEYTIRVQPTKTIEQASPKQPTPKQSPPKQPAPIGPASDESTKMSKKTISNDDNEQVIITMSEEEDEAFEEHIIDFMVDVGTLPSSLLAKQQERDVAIRLLLPYQLGGEKPSVGYTLCCDALSGMLAPGHVTIVRGRSVTSDDVLEKVQERIVCDTSTDWVPQLMLSDLIAKIDVAIEAEEIVSPLNYAEICIAQFLFYSRI